MRYLRPACVHEWRERRVQILGKRHQHRNSQVRLTLKLIIHWKMKILQVSVQTRIWGRILWKETSIFSAWPSEESWIGIWNWKGCHRRSRAGRRRRETSTFSTKTWKSFGKIKMIFLVIKYMPYNCVSSHTKGSLSKNTFGGYAPHPLTENYFAKKTLAELGVYPLPP